MFKRKIVKMMADVDMRKFLRMFSHFPENTHLFSVLSFVVDSMQNVEQIRYAQNMYLGDTCMPRMY